MNGRFVYSALPENSIRLLTFSLNHTSDLICNMTTARIKDKPVYYALSYTWGNTAVTKHIRCNGDWLDISANLHEAIHTLFSPPLNQEGPIWIDAICINQKDDEEKSVQVRHMGDIFREACQVVVWLGPSTQESDYAMEKLEWLGEILTPIAFPPGHLAFSEFGLPDLEDKLWSTLGFLFSREWFSRLWTFQEAVLAADVKYICGNKSVLGDTFFKAACGLWRLGLQNVCFRLRAVEDHKDGILASEHIRAAKEIIVGQGSVNFVFLMGIADSRLSFDPRDKVYGMLGLTSESFRSRVPISYFGDASDGAVKTYINCAKAAIQEPRPFILSMVSGRHRLLGLPTWCPNFSAPTTLVYFGNEHRAGVFEDDVPPFKAGIRSGTNILAITGFRVGKVSEIVKRNLRRGTMMTTEWSRKALKWETRCLEFARKTLSIPSDSDIIPSDHILTLTANSRPDLSLEPGGDYHQAYLDVMVHLKNFAAGAGNAYPPIERRPLFHDLWNRIFGEYAGHRYFNTKDGRLGIGPPDTKPDDIVCIIYGAAAPFILREADEKAEEWALLGDAFIPGLMDLKETLKDPKIKVSPEVFTII